MGYSDPSSPAPASLATDAIVTRMSFDRTSHSQTTPPSALHPETQPLAVAPTCYPLATPAHLRHAPREQVTYRIEVVEVFGNRFR